MAASVLEEGGCVVDEVDFEWHDCLAIDVCMDMVAAEVAHYLRPIIEGRREELSESILGLLNLSQPGLEDFLISMDKRDLLARDLTGFFEHRDILLCPIASNLAHGHEAEKLVIDSQHVGSGQAANITATFGLVGTPAISVVFSTSADGMPIGIQIVVAHRDERTLLRVARVLERA